ncbi:sodium-driven chloride bicarbonate exchanger-like isoform X3 [Panonychus citri]|uniref:sodium-driven chloride bicarbonate exchanger-like isoform X3 n=1 Tax=Panonychus citri TaxID=50023 RepID=UPI0023070F21|nr:sodium-driven chloride bicarbonate exchanger-like isoform X3 [Panonychus citri]
MKMTLPWMDANKSGIPMDEAPKDPGVLTTHPSYADTDFEGHRAHAMYVGFHVPGGSYRRRGHHRRHKHHHHKNNGHNGGTKKREDGTLSSEQSDIRPVTPPAERVQFILGEDDQDGTHESHPLFSELEELVSDGHESEWRETARWIKFEEDVEEGGDRWSKPHVATISLHSLFELRSCILNGTVMLDLEGSSLDQIADLVLENMVNSGQLSLEAKDKVKESLLRRHRHQHEKRHDKDKNRLPLIRSLADIGRNSSKSMFGSHCNLDKITKDTTTVGGHPNAPVTAPVTSSDWNPQFGKHLNVSLGQGSNHDAGGGSGGSIPLSPSATSLHLHANNQQLSGVSLTDHNASSSADLQHKANQAFMKKVPPGAEADNILVGEVEFLDKHISAFVRLSQACHLGDLTEVPVPTRFLFILLGPHSIPGRYHEVGRAMATLMSDEIFHDVAYKSKSRQDLLAGVDEFLDAVTILPPGAWDPSIRIEPPQQIPSQESRKKHDPSEPVKLVDEEEEEQKEREASGLKRSGRWFGGLINDFKRKAPWYLSDFKDALALQSIASVIFLYFACLAPIITFGGLLGDATGKNIATMESLLSGAVCGILYGFFSGQPLTILGSTGPVLVYETIVFNVCQKFGLQYLPIRMWIGLWTAFYLLVFVAVDASAFVCYITRFTEENFATLISVIFIYKAVEKVLEIGKEYPIRTGDVANINFTCNCLDKDNNSWNIQKYAYNSTGIKYCIENSGALMGPGCNEKNVPDVFLFSVLLFIFTFTISVSLKEFKFTPFFPSKVRQFVSDFSVVIAIFVMTLIDYKVGLSTPKLVVPDKFKPTSDERGGWMIPIIGNNPWWMPIACPFPALLAVILIFMDQQITAVIVNRKENKLKKGCGYHLDLFVLSILIAICSIFGLPWFVAATVLSMTHVNSLKMESESAAPGEKPQFLGVREQRVTHICIFILCGLSVFMTSVLRNIPMPVLYGVFLYMGTSSLKGSQFFERILILLMPQKYQPDYVFLRHVPTPKVHLFTAIQVSCFAILWLIKSYSKTSILFPLMLVVIIGVRACLDFFFTQRELKLLDDVMPDSARKKAEEEKEDDDSKGEEDDNQMIPNSSLGNVAIPLANGNILKIPVNKFNAEPDQCHINITEQLAKSGTWKSIDQSQKSKTNKENKAALKESKEKDKSTGKKKRGNKKDAKTEEEKKRLSTMTEEDDEEDCGITIKIDGPTPIPSVVPSTLNSPQEDSIQSMKHNETPV